MLSQDEKWLLEEKYGGAESAPVFNESLDEIKNKYSWGAAFRADCARLAAGEPLGYVIGSVPFLDSVIYLDSHPLIPRVETEFWVEKVIARCKEHLASHLGSEDSQAGRVWLGQLSPSESSARRGRSPVTPLRILDLCAGSGCIGVAVAKSVPEAHVTFADIDPAHLPTIEKNIRENGIAPERTTVVQSDVFENIEGRFDLILTNPPYIDPKLDRTQTSVKYFEPHVALYGGADGMEVIERIVEGARAKLAPHGTLYLEHEPEQADAIAQLAHTHYLTCVTHTDQYDTPRYSTCTHRP